MEKIGLLLFLPLLVVALNPYEEEIITNRWKNTGWLWCDLIEVTIKGFAVRTGFRLPDQEIEELTVLWEKNLPEYQFSASFPTNGTFAEIGHRRFDAFKTGICQLYNTKHKLINLVAKKFAPTAADKDMILKYTKELSLGGTVTLLRKVFIHRSRNEWLEIESHFQDHEFFTFKTTRSGLNCFPYLPKIHVDNSLPIN